MAPKPFRWILMETLTSLAQPTRRIFQFLSRPFKRLLAGLDLLAPRRVHAAMLLSPRSVLTARLFYIPRTLAGVGKTMAVRLRSILQETLMLQDLQRQPISL